MKKIRLLIFMFLIGSPCAHSQLMLGSKIEYNRYAMPGMNGATLNVFAEAPFGKYDSFSIRSGIFGRLPLHFTDQDVSLLNLMVNVPTDLVYDPSQEGSTVHTTFNDIGIFSEFSYFPFDGDPSGNDFYLTLRFSFSYSTLTRWSDDPITNQLLELNKRLKNGTKLSYGFGGGFGYQFHLGPRTLLFSELMIGLPFVSIDDSVPNSSLTDYPLFYFSVNAGFRYFLFE